MEKNVRGDTFLHFKISTKDQISTYLKHEYRVFMFYVKFDIPGHQ